MSESPPTPEDDSVPPDAWSALRRAVRLRLSERSGAWASLATPAARLPTILPSIRLAVTAGDTSVPEAGFFAGELRLLLRARATSELDDFADGAFAALSGYQLDTDGWHARGFHLARALDDDDGPNPEGDGSIRRRELAFTFHAWRKNIGPPSP